MARQVRRRVGEGGRVAVLSAGPDDGGKVRDELVVDTGGEAADVTGSPRGLQGTARESQVQRKNNVIQPTLLLIDE